MNGEWLADFFSGDNQIDLTKVMAGEFGQAYQGMMEPLVKSVSINRWPVILPFSDGWLRFYAATQDERLLLELRRVLDASLGTADTDGELAIIKKASNSSEEVLLKYAPAGLIKISMLDSSRNNLDAKQRVFNALKRVLSLYDQRPKLAEQIRRPVGRILREFFTACQVSDGVSAEELYLELKNCGNISQRNLLFLNFQGLAAGKKWDQIINHEKLSYCLQGRIPVQLRLLLLRAIASTKFRIVLQEGFSAIPIEKVRTSCQGLSTLFVMPPEFGEFKSIADEWKTWAIGATVLGCVGIEPLVPEDVEVDWLDGLYSWATVERPRKTKQDEEEEAKQDAPHLDLKRVIELLQYSLISTYDETKKIVDRLSGLPPDVKEQLKGFPTLNNHWCLLKQEFEAREYGWEQWFSDILKREDTPESFYQRAIGDCQYWQTSSFDSDAIQVILEAKTSEQVAAVLRDIIPVMLEWINERGVKCQSSLWIKILELLALDDVVNTQDVRLANLLLEKLLNNQYGVDEYRTVLQALELLLDKVSSIKCYSATLELIDLILENPCPDQSALNLFWMTLQGFALQKWQRISSLERQITVFLSQEILGEGANTVFPEVYNTDENVTVASQQFPDLAGKKLAIYSLTEGAARRAKKMLEEIFKGLLIDLNNDHVATNALQNLAKKAEYFIFASDSAKHQAFYVVSKIRNDLIYPLGKGASSIVRAFVSALGS